MNKRKNIVYAILAALLLAVVAVLFFAPADFEGKVLQQADIQQGLANGEEAREYHEETGNTTRWTNSLFSGMPTFQISPSYSSNKMLEWVQGLYTLWLPSPANLLFGMMLGFFIMCLCLKMKWHTALFGAVAWGFSTYFIIIIGAGHIWKFLTLMYVPPMIGGVFLCYRRRFWSGAAITALFTAMQVGSNHPQMTYYFLFVIGAIGIAAFISSFNKGRLMRWLYSTLVVIGAGGLGVAANLASLYASYEYSKETIRGKATELTVEGKAPAADGLDHDYITQWSYGVDETMTLLIPNIKGGASLKPVGGEMYPKSVLDTETGQGAYLSPQEQQFVAYFMQYFGDQPMTNGPVYVGAFVLVLAVLAMFIVKGPRWGVLKWLLFAVSILAILLAWGHNFDAFTTFFIDNVPFYNKFRTPSSMLVVVEFCIPLLAAMAVMKMGKMHHFLRRYGTTFYVICGFAALICLVGWISPSTFGEPWSASELEFLSSSGALGNPSYANALNTIAAARLDLVSADCLRSLLFIVLGFLACYLYLKGAYKSRAIFSCSLAAIVLIDLFTVNKRYVDNDNFTYPKAEATFTPTKADAQILKDTAMNYRVLDIDNFTQARSSYFHKTIGGYHAAKLTRYNDLIDKQILNNNPEVINMLNAKYFIKDGEVIDNPMVFGNAWLVDLVSYVNGPDAEMKALETTDLRHRAVADKKFASVLGRSQGTQPGDTIFETSYAPDRLTYSVTSKKGGVAVFSEVYFPWGWEATVDGNPVEIGRVNYVLRAIQVPAGHHTVEFVFHPKRLESANTISIVAVSLIFLLCLIAICWMFLGPKYFPHHFPHHHHHHHPHTRHGHHARRNDSETTKASKPAEEDEDDEDEDEEDYDEDDYDDDDEEEDTKP